MLKQRDGEFLLSVPFFILTMKVFANKRFTFFKKNVIIYKIVLKTRENSDDN